jgi:hypothetical protein
LATIFSRALWYRDLGTQSSQLLSLQPELGNFPSRMLIHSILPAISRLCLAAPNLWVYAMPLHAELSEFLPEDKYMYFAGPYVGEPNQGCFVLYSRLVVTRCSACVQCCSILRTCLHRCHENNGLLLLLYNRTAVHIFSAQGLNTPDLPNETLQVTFA